MTRIKLHFWDLDGTLLNADSEILWKFFLLKKNIYPWYKLLPLFSFAFQKTINRFQHDLWIKFVSKELDQLKEDKKKNLIEEFITTLDSKWYASSINLLKEQRKNGDVTYLTTATISHLAKPIAKKLNFDHCCSSQQETKSNIFGSPPPFSGLEKAKRITLIVSQYKNRGQTVESWYYGNSRDDIPAMNCVNHAIAICPDRPLRKYALSKGWRILN